MTEITETTLVVFKGGDLKHRREMGPEPFEYKSMAELDENGGILRSETATEDYKRLHAEMRERCIQLMSIWPEVDSVAAYEMDGGGDKTLEVWRDEL